jgi:C4-type Zn-finger protein
MSFAAKNDASPAAQGVRSRIPFIWHTEMHLPQHWEAVKGAASCASPDKSRTDEQDKAKARQKQGKSRTAKAGQTNMTLKQADPFQKCSGIRSRTAEAENLKNS